MKIKSKIIFGFFVVVFFAWLIAVLSGINIHMVDNEYDDLMEVITPMRDEIHAMEGIVQKINAKTFEFLLFGGMTERNETAIEMRNLEDSAKRLLEYSNNFSEEEKKIGDRLLPRINNLNIQINSLMDIKARTTAPEELMQAKDTSLRPAIDELMDQFSAHLKILQERQIQKAEKIDSFLDVGLLLLIVISVVTLIVAIITSFILGRSISRPIEELTHAAENISKGEINQPVEKKTKDEIGSLAEAFERMRVSLKSVLDEMKK